MTAWTPFGITSRPPRDPPPGLPEPPQDPPPRPPGPPRDPPRQLLGPPAFIQKLQSCTIYDKHEIAPISCQNVLLVSFDLNRLHIYHLGLVTSN